MARFVVDLGDMEMSSAAEAEMAGVIQKAVLGQVADLRYNEPFAVYFPREWLGFIARRDLGRLKELEGEIGKFAGQG
ncbi:MAG: hypothetical protein GY952_19320 [Rhodobacteraceae bacterium]|nr:hypothetical protein [Paracoccaceae bacterium]